MTIEQSRAENITRTVKIEDHVCIAFRGGVSVGGIPEGMVWGRLIREKVYFRMQKNYEYLKLNYPEQKNGEEKCTFYLSCD